MRMETTKTTRRWYVHVCPSFTLSKSLMEIVTDENLSCGTRVQALDAEVHGDSTGYPLPMVRASAQEDQEEEEMARGMRPWFGSYPVPMVCTRSDSLALT